MHKLATKGENEAGTNAGASNQILVTQSRKPSRWWL